MGLVLTFYRVCAIIIGMKRVLDNQIPSYERKKPYSFDTTKKSLEVYRELNAIAEEIEQCRLRNC